MNIHSNFLKKEINAQVLEFEKILSKKAVSLLLESDIIVGKYTGINNGKFIVECSSQYVPRKGEHYQLFLLPYTYGKFSSWGDRGLTYSDLLKNSTAISSGKCLWVQKKKEETDIRCGVSRVETSFQEKLHENTLVFFGPKEPPIQYLQNLKQYSESTRGQSCELLSLKKNNQWDPELISDNNLRPDFFINQLNLEDTLVLQGPPGTGKTTLIGKIISDLLKKKKSVLVTSMTNNALMEIATQKSIEEFVLDNKVLKSNLSTDELNELDNLNTLTDLTPMDGYLHLSTFHNTSRYIDTYPRYDYVIIDEASQAFSTTLSAFQNLGHKNLWVGDHMQLSPIVLLNKDRIEEIDALPIVNGFESVCENNIYPGFMLEKTRRFGDRGARYTSVFYQGKLKSAFEKKYDITRLPKVINLAGGPISINAIMKNDDKSPLDGFYKVKQIIDAISDKIPSNDILIITPFNKTVKSLKKYLVENNININVETIDRVQGKTVEVAILLLCNSSYFFSLKQKRFNVSTSRSRLNTFIVHDENIFSELSNNSLVGKYLNMMKNEKLKLIGDN